MLIEEQWGIKIAYYKNAFPVVVKSLWAQTQKNTH